MAPRLGRTAAFCCLFVLSLGALADIPQTFAKLRDRSQPLDSLSSFLERYVGTCTDLLTRAECQANAKRARAEMTGKSYYLILDESATRMLRPGTFDPRTRKYRLDLTPFFDAGGLALTDGAPLGQDGEGRPRIPLMPLYAELAPDQFPMDLERLLRTNNVKVHIVFKPTGTWSLPSKGGQSYEGVKAKFLAVRLTNARNGDEIALRVKD